MAIIKKKFLRQLGKAIFKGNMKSRLIVSLFMFWVSSSVAQDLSAAFTQGYTWEESPVLHELDSVEKLSAAVFLLDFRQCDFRFDENDELYMDYTRHNIIHVNSQAAVEDYNKFYISLAGTQDLLSIRARSISPEGVVKELEEESIREIDNLENAGAFRIFAIEGLVPGGEVEYAYTVRRFPKLYGREVFQRDIPVRHAVLELISPANLIFSTKAYNGLAKTQDSVLAFTRRMQSVTNNIPAALSERYALYQPHLQRMEFNLSNNLFKPTVAELNWDGMAQRYQQIVYDASKEDVKAIRSILKSAKIHSIQGTEQKIQGIERWLKKEILLQEGNGPEFEDPEFVLRNRYANTFGMLKLMAGCLAESGIYHELVIAADREGFPLDPDFPTWSYLEDAFFYFPVFKKFLSPSNYEYRYGSIPFVFLDNAALFIVPGSKSGLVEYRIDSIPAASLNEHYDNIDIQASFVTESAEVKMKVKRTFSGYRASFIQPYLELLPVETRDEIGSDILLGSAPDAVIKTQSFDKISLGDVEAGVPLILNGELTSSSLLERAGSRFLVKVGEMIGPQVEMYQAGPRQFEIDLQYPHGYQRNIKLSAPSGYRFKGMEDLNRDITVYDTLQQPIMGFVSGYRENGKDLEINIHEYYGSTTFPANRFDEFREVINAAADFNKITLLLEQE